MDKRLILFSLGLILIDGMYRAESPRMLPLGEAFVSFSKAGFKTVESSRKPTDCSDVTLVNNVVLAP
jgi:hypothetical protein